MFDKEAITIADVQREFSISYSKAAKVIREIKSTSDRLGITGKVHIEDYKQHYKIAESK